MEFVADPGTAWCGSLEVFEDLVKGVKAAGGTAIKPQLWPKKIYKGHKMKKEALKAHITRSTLRRMSDICVRHRLPMFCSVFSVWSFKMMMEVAADYPPMGERVKISCGKNKAWGLIDTVLEWEVPQVLISVASVEDVKALKKHGVFDHQSDITLLYCVPNYPTKPGDVMFPRGWPEPITGFSDHTLGLVAPLTAAALGFDMIERHVMLSEERYSIHIGEVPGFPDKVCAATPPQFKTIVKACKAARRMAGYD